jgi:hypothetical protein
LGEPLKLIFDTKVKTMFKYVFAPIALSLALGLALPTSTFAETAEPSVDRTSCPRTKDML